MDGIKNSDNDIEDQNRKMALGGASRQVGCLKMTSLRHISGSLLMGSTAQLYLVIGCGRGINRKIQGSLKKESAPTIGMQEKILT